MVSGTLLCLLATLLGWCESQRPPYVGGPVVYPQVLPQYTEAPNPEDLNNRFGEETTMKPANRPGSLYPEDQFNQVANWPDNKKPFWFVNSEQIAGHVGANTTKNNGTQTQSPSGGSQQNRPTGSQQNRPTGSQQNSPTGSQQNRPSGSQQNRPSSFQQRPTPPTQQPSNANLANRFGEDNVQPTTQQSGLVWLIYYG